MSDEHALKLRACTLLVDALVAAGDGDSPGTLDKDALRLAFGRVLQDRVVQVAVVDGKVQVDPTPLLYGSLDLLRWLVITLAKRADADTFDVIADLRQQITDWTDAACS